MRTTSSRGRSEPPVLQFVVVLACIVTAASAPAVVVRVATFNVSDGVGDPASDGYRAVSNILVRIDADIVALQELKASDLPNAEQLAAGIGYTVFDVSGLGPFAGGFLNGFFSRLPIAERDEFTSPSEAVELTRLPFYVRLRPTGAAEDLHLVNVHLKGGSDPVDEFRRSVEALRIREALAARGLDGEESLLVLGDMNGDPDRYQTWGFWVPPDGLPQSYVLGPVTWPVLYSEFPTDAFAGEGLAPVDAPQQNGVGAWTWSGYSLTRRFDYLVASSALAGRGYAAEAYTSTQDGTFPGLPKHGQPLSPETSLLASDHLIVFGDFAVPDAPLMRFVHAAPSDGMLALEFEMDPGTAGTPVLEARPSIGSGLWVRLNAVLEGPGPGGRWRFLTGVPATRREYRVRDALP